MTTTTGNTRQCRPADSERRMHLALHDEAGLLTLRRLRPWHRMLARCAAARLDRKLAAGISPETSAILAARAMQLTSMKSRRDLGRSVQRILAAAAVPAGVAPEVVPAVAPEVVPAALPAARPVRGRVAHPPRLPVNRARISQSALPLARLAALLAGPGPVRVQGVAMVSRLLADGTGPLYHDARGADLADIIGTAVQVLTL